jgi:glycosyltransferase involved in cell wall biosynthesis
MNDGKRLLIISPVRNEADHLERVGRGIERQSRPPDAWLVVDDGSDDGSLTRLRELAARIPYMRVLATPPGYTSDNGDRHAVAAAPRAFNWGLRATDWRRFTHLGKLDGDIELPEDYFERLLAEFDRDPRLGIAGGTLVERGRTGWETTRSARQHVRGALKLYRRECFKAIGGVQERLGWDGIDETYARMRGYETRSFDHIVARHRRPLGAADGSLRGKVRRGSVHYVLGYNLAWATFKSLQLAFDRSGPTAGAAFLYGYLESAWRSLPRVEDAEYRRFIRDEQRHRMTEAIRHGLSPLWSGVVRRGAEGT